MILIEHFWTNGQNTPKVSLFRVSNLNYKVGSSKNQDTLAVFLVFLNMFLLMFLILLSYQILVLPLLLLSKVYIPKRLKVDKFPHFLQKKESYHSTSVLGEIYDRVEKFKAEEPVAVGKCLIHILIEYCNCFLVVHLTYSILYVQKLRNFRLLRLESLRHVWGYGKKGTESTDLRWRKHWTPAVNRKMT